MSLASFGVRKPVVANLVMFALIFAGIAFGVTLRKEFFPETDPTLITIAAPYPGASPDEVEQSLAIKIEDAVRDLEGVDEINTTAGTGVASVTIEFNDSVNIDEALFEVKREMDALQDLPEESERITVDKIEPNLPAIVLSIAADEGVDARTLKDSIRRIRRDLESLPGMGSITESGTLTGEILVEADPDLLLEHGLSLPAVSEAIRSAMVELPGGSVRTGAENVAIRTMGAEETAAEVREVVVKATPSGQVLRVKDIAEVSSTFADVDIRTRLNGRPSVSLTVFKEGSEDAVEIAAMVKAYAAGRRGEAFEPTLVERFASIARRPGSEEPLSSRHRAHLLGESRAQSDPVPGELLTTTDLARFIVGRLELLSRNALQGGALVLLTLIVLLNFRVAFWTAIGLAVSLLGTLAFMHFVGVTLNLLTMFGLIIVLGLLVDDAIVVAENITARYENGEPADVAAVEGTNQVNWPVVATVLTTICAFMPLSMIEGNIGDLLGALPVVVACALAVSLIECLFILPSHMAHSLHALDKSKKKGARAGFFTKLERRFDRGRDAMFSKFIVPAYLASLRLALKIRYLSLAIALACVIGCFGLVAGRIVEFTFLGSSDAETVDIQVRMPIGTPTEKTDRAIRVIERLVNAQPEVQSAFVQVGNLSSIDGTAPDSSQSHLGQIIMELTPVERRDRSAEQLIDELRNAIPEMPEVESIRIEEVAGGPGGSDLNFTVVGSDPEVMMRVVRDVKRLMREKAGVRDIADDADSGRRELRFRLRDGARELGFTQESVARQVRAAVFGLEAHTFAGDREDVDVRVTVPEDVRRSLAQVEQLHLFTPGGTPVPASEVVEIEETEGYASIRRLDGRRAIAVTADVDTTTINPQTGRAANTEQIAAELRPKLEELAAGYPGIDILERGRQQDVNESLASLPQGMLLAVVMIYVILAWLFSSYVQPIVVLAAVPFATIGMILGHLALGFDLTILSLIGFIALTGVVVNDSLIFMSFFNSARERGLSVFDACLATARARIRAILLTTITTVLGLLPLMLEQSFQARFLIPMAITIACGLMSATFIILIILPCLLCILDDVKRVVRYVWSGGETELSPEPTRPSMLEAVQSGGGLTPAELREPGASDG